MCLQVKQKQLYVRGNRYLQNKLKLKNVLIKPFVVEVVQGSFFYLNIHLVKKPL